MQIREIMSRQLEWVSTEHSIRDVADLMAKHNIGAVPVMEGDRIIGTLTDRDIVVRCIAKGLNPSSTRVGQAMTREHIWCYEDQDDRDAATIMEEKHVRRLFVHDRNDKLVGVLSVGDLACCQGDEPLAGEVLHHVAAHAVH